MSQRWGFIGCGNLAQAIIQGCLDRKKLAPSQIFVTDRSQEKLKAFVRKTNVRFCKTNIELLSHCDIIVLATKPQDILIPLNELTAEVTRSKTIVSLAAGVDSKLLREFLDNAGGIIRVMANTPAMIQKGLFGIYVVKQTSGSKNEVISLFASIGEVVLLENDGDVDAITSGSASGVGFVFSFMEEFGNWFEKKGFTKDEARNVTIETFLGAAELAKRRPELSLSDLRVQVTSKKGTTHAGLVALKRSKVGAGLRSGLDAAYKRSTELAKSLLKSVK